MLSETHAPVRGLADLPPAQNDSLIALIAMVNADPRPDKIDVGVGVFRDGAGNTPILATIKEAEQRLVDTQKTKSYLGSAGDKRFTELLRPILLGDQAGDDRIIGLQTPGGCGALRLGFEILARANPQARVFIGSPTWPNHPPIVRSVCSIPDPNDARDEVWLIVQRTINGKTERYVELFAPEWENSDDQEQAFYVDSGLIFDGRQAQSLQPGAGATVKGTVGVPFTAGGAVVSVIRLASSASAVRAVDASRCPSGAIHDPSTRSMLDGAPHTPSVAIASIFSGSGTPARCAYAATLVVAAASPMRRFALIARRTSGSPLIVGRSSTRASARRSGSS